MRSISPKKNTDRRRSVVRGMDVAWNPTAKIERTRKGPRVMKSKRRATTNVDVADSKVKRSLLFRR